MVFNSGFKGLIKLATYRNPEPDLSTYWTQISPTVFRATRQRQTCHR